MATSICWLASISTTIAWIVMTDFPDLQRMNPNPNKPAGQSFHYSCEISQHLLDVLIKDLGFSSLIYGPNTCKPNGILINYR